jgi:hypothetical protein
VKTAEAHELGYASTAIIAALLDTLIRNRIISRADASDTLNDAVTALKGLGNHASAAGAIRIISDVSSQTAKHRLARPRISMCDVTNPAFTDKDKARELLEV